MLGSFGSVVFQVSDKLVRTFSSFNRKSSATFAEHAVLEEKPLLQFTGNNLTEISFSVKLSKQLGLVPAKELEALQDILTSGAAQPLIIGGQVMGHFVLKDVDENWNQVDNKGRILSASINLSLKEFV